nr:Chain B, SER-LEU-PRO-PHE-THR-PHE-LYS-VAL-PRO-ALA-PRO-PRO-PRO-SER-LEU-PRO-PRO-SER [Homo sapiens]
SLPFTFKVPAPPPSLPPSW